MENEILQQILEKLDTLGTKVDRVEQKVTKIEVTLDQKQTAILTYLLKAMPE